MLGGSVLLAPVFLTAALALALFLSGFLSLLAPLPFGFTLARRGPLAGLLAAVLAGGILLGLYRIESITFLPFRAMSQFTPGEAASLGLISFAYNAWIGLSLAMVGRSGPRNLSFEKGIGTILLSTLGLTGLCLWTFSRLTGVDLMAECRSGIQQTVDQMIGLNDQPGLKEAAPMIVSAITSLLPGLIISMTFFTVTLNLTLLKRLAARGGTERLFFHFPDFGSWRLPEGVIWVPISAGSLYFANLYGLKNALLTTLLYNLFVLLAVLYLTQGLAIVSFFFRRRLSPLVRMAGYLALFLFLQAVGILIVILGLFDFWFDFRKLKKIA